MSTALITGASRGLGLELARALAADGWDLVIDARGAEALAEAAAELRATGPAATVTAIAGDVTDPDHRQALAAAVGGRLDLLVNNASILGPSPQPTLDRYPLADLRTVYEVNVLAPLALFQAVRSALLAADGVVVNVTSDASVQAYEGWGGYGSSKAALDHLSAILGEEEPSLAVYAVDPGDLRTRLHQQAFPGEDISDRPHPATAVPGFLELLYRRPRSGRYRAADLQVEVPVGGVA